MLLLLCVGTVSGQPTTRTRLAISIQSPGVISVDAELSSPTRSWSFRNAYAGILGIAERVEDFRASGEAGQDARVKRSATGEFRSDLDANRISYTVKLSDPRPTDVSHISWLVGDRGFLMFADLVPQDIESLSAEFKLPVGWSVETSIPREPNGRYEVTAPETSVFFVGRSLRKTSKTVDGLMLETVLNGTWRFKDNDALKAAGRVMREYLALTRFKLPGKSVVMIAPFPISMGGMTWKSETRGSTVVLLMDPSARIQNWVGQLGVIFTHELLHLWVPNSLKLAGDYDWFFEGFTLYIALRTALELKIINFKVFLDTLAGAYDAYTARPDDRSLIEESEKRWISQGSHVYVKGMLVAFLYDLIVRKESGGKTSLADRYQDLFNGSVTDKTNGNEAIISLLRSSAATSDFARAYIESRTKLELEPALLAYGLQLDASGKSAQLRVSRELNQDQKRLLRSIGYRN